MAKYRTLVGSGFFENLTPTQIQMVEEIVNSTDKPSTADTPPSTPDESHGEGEDHTAVVEGTSS